MNIRDCEKTQLLKSLNDPKQGRKYLIDALETNDEKSFLQALYHLMDAVLWDIQSETDLLSKQPKF